MRCQVCNRDAGPEGGVCEYCGAKVKSILGDGAPIAIPIEELREHGQKRLRRAERLRRRTRDHAIAGGVIFFALNVVWWFTKLLFAIGQVAFAGMLGRLPPGEGGSFWGFVLGMFLAVFFAAVTAVLVGAPAGYVISKRNTGPLGGAFLGAGIFALGFPLVHIWAIVGAHSPGVALLFHFIVGGLVGLVTGVFIGFHVLGDSL
ncbi:MAG: hypothetical protein ACYTFI_08485 [Planctomycetota bacterium]|jgi:hypothetical protein